MKHLNHRLAIAFVVIVICVALGLTLRHLRAMLVTSDAACVFGECPNEAEDEASDR